MDDNAHANQTNLVDAFLESEEFFQRIKQPAETLDLNQVAYLQDYLGKARKYPPSRNVNAQERIAGEVEF